MLGRHAPATATLVVAASLAVLAILAGGVPISYVSEPADPPYGTDTVTIAEISGGMYAVITHNQWIDIDAGVQIISITDRPFRPTSPI